MKNYVNRLEKDGKVSYTMGVKYTNKNGEAKTGFIPVNFSSKIEAPAKTGLMQINSFMLGVAGEGKAKVIINNYVEATKDTKAPENAIARIWVNKNKFGTWQTSAKNEYNGKTTYANMPVTFRKGSEPEGESALIAVKEAFFGGYDTKEGTYAPTLVIMDYEASKAKEAAETATEEGASEAAEEEFPC